MSNSHSFSAEIAALIKLAAPVSLAQLALVGMSATDVLIAGRASTLELAGMNLGANTWNMVILFFMGIGLATQPLVAKHFGARNSIKLKHQMHQSLWMCFALGLLATIVVCLSAWAMQFISYEIAMLRIARDFLLVISLCAIPMCLIPATRGALEGMSLTREVFAINFLAFLLNIPLDYVLVNGLYGFPKLGGVGCAWATVVLMWLAFAASLAVLKFHPRVRDANLLSAIERPNYATIRTTLAFGLPIGASLVVELSMFSGAGMMIAMFGEIQASAHAVAIIIASMSFMLYMGIGQGVTIRASQLLGAGQADNAWYCIKVGTFFNLMISIFFCGVYILFTRQIVHLFSSDPEVIKLAIALLYFGAAFQVVDCLQIAIICALRAYHDTSSPPKYQLFAFWMVGIPLGIGLSFYGWWPGLEGARGMWMGMVVSLSLVSVLLVRRLASFASDGKHS